MGTRLAFCTCSLRATTLAEVRHRTHPVKKGKGGLDSNPKCSEIKGMRKVLQLRMTECQQIHGAYKRRGSPWLEEPAQPILNTTLLERFSVFQLSSFDSMSHHPLQPNTSLAIPPTAYSLCFRNSRDRKMPTISSMYGLPWSSKPTTCQNKLFHSFLLP